MMDNEEKIEISDEKLGELRRSTLILIGGLSNLSTPTDFIRINYIIEIITQHLLASYVCSLNGEKDKLISHISVSKDFLEKIKDSLIYHIEKQIKNL